MLLIEVTGSVLDLRGSRRSVMHGSVLCRVDTNDSYIAQVEQEARRPALSAAFPISMVIRLY